MQCMDIARLFEIAKNRHRLTRARSIVIRIDLHGSGTPYDMEFSIAVVRHRHGKLPTCPWLINQKLNDFKALRAIVKSAPGGCAASFPFSWNKSHPYEVLHCIVNINHPSGRALTTFALHLRSNIQEPESVWRGLPVPIGESKILESEKSPGMGYPGIVNRA